MRKLKRLVLIAVLVVVAMSVEAQIQVNSLGNVGIGTSATGGDKLVTGNGNVLFGGWAPVLGVVLRWTDNQYRAPELFCLSDGNLNIGKSTNRVNYIYSYCLDSRNIWNTSDERLKENINNMESVLSRLMKVKGKTYNFKNNGERKMVSEKDKERKDYGFLAQDLQKIFPDLVREPDSTSAYYSVNYIGMIPLLVEALKEMNDKNDKQDSLINAQNQKIKTLIDCCENKSNSKNKSLDTQSTDSQIATNIESAILYQNAPNPFSKTTEIRFYLPSIVKSAALYIYDMQGIQKKKIEISQRANGSVTINGSEFVAGMYIYTLIADGKEIDTKRMILTE